VPTYIVTSMKTATVFRALSVFLFTVKTNASPSITSDSLGALLPSTPPSTETTDPWRCATENITQYFDVPTPTGALQTAMVSYGSELLQTCSSTGTDRLTCAFPDSTLWCAFSTVAPSNVLTAYSAYASLASSWWSNHSSAAFSLAENCPIGWYKAASNSLVGFLLLNETIIFSGCYAEAHPTSGSSIGRMPAATPGSRSSVSVTIPTRTQVSSIGLGRAENVDMWMVAGGGLAAMAGLVNGP